MKINPEKDPEDGENRTELAFSSMANTVPGQAPAKPQPIPKISEPGINVFL